MTVQQIAKRAQAIRRASPSKKWTDCIKQASKELKKGTGRAKAVSGAKPKTVKRITLNPRMLDSSQSYYRYQNEEREIQSDMEGRLYIMVGGKAVYFKKPYPRLSGTKGSKRTRSKPPAQKVSGLKGIKGRPVGMVLNGIGKLVKGGYYYQQNPVTGEPIVDVLFHYRGKVGSGMYPLHFDCYFRNSKTGKFAVKPVLYELALDTAITFLKVKKPTYKELAIGHLKLLK